jgi:hypothetical protein
MVLRYFRFIGLGESKNLSDLVSKEKYNPVSDLQLAERFCNYLKDIIEYQNERRITIENKNSQLVGQASIVASIFALFIPLLIDTFLRIPFYIKVFIILIFITVLFHYLLTIIHSIRTLKIHKYKYATRSTTSITKDGRPSTEIEFINQEISDLIYIINQTTPIDNIKGENLIFAARCFEIANYGLVFLALVIIGLTFTLKNEIPEVNVKNLKDFSISIPDTMNIRSINSMKLELRKPSDSHKTTHLTSDSLIKH